MSNRVRTWIAGDLLERVSELAANRSLKVSSALDAIITAGLAEIESAQRYELLPTGILLVRDGGQDAPPASRRNQRASTASPKPAKNRAKARGRAQSNTDSPQTAITSQTQPSVAQSTPQPAQRAPEPATSPQTATTAQTQQVETNTPVPPFLTGEMIPSDVYEDLTDYEKECLSHEAFLLSPDGQVVLRDEPPIGKDGTRIAAGTWAYFHTSFLPGDDPDNFVGLTWKIKEK